MSHCPNCGQPTLGKGLCLGCRGLGKIKKKGVKKMPRRFSATSRNRNLGRSSSSGKKIATLKCLEGRDRNNEPVMIEMDTPYSKEFLADFRTSVSTKKRTWFADEQKWWVAYDQLEKLTFLMDKHYSETLLLDFPAQEVQTDVWSVLFLVPNTPVEIVKLVYKHLAKQHHPDVGGDAEKFVQIKQAYEVIVKESANE